jgi:two-component system OmpR family response regulator
MTRCLLIDDDEEIRSALAKYLGRFGFAVHAAPGAAGLHAALAAGSWQVIVLDVMLRDGNGLDLCRTLRQQGHATPIVMLTAQGDPVSRVLGLELGADDYLAKPFEPRELVARLHAVLRRVPGTACAAPHALPRAVQFAGWTLDCLQRLLISPAQVVVALSNAEYRLLAAFVSHAGRVLSRERLVEATAAPGVVVNGRSIDLAVSRLRQKLGDARDAHALIRTVRGEGYVLEARVSA